MEPFVAENLTPELFEKFYRDGNLNGGAGELSLPVAKPIRMRLLYKLSFGEKITSNSLAPSDIVAIIAFGSAIRGKEYGVIPKKWYFPFTRRKLIKPRDADILVVTKNGKCLPRTHAKAEWKHIPAGFVSPSALGYSYVVASGIDLMSMSTKELVDSLQTDEKPIGKDALENGVPLFADWGRLEELREQTGLEKRTPSVVRWAWVGKAISGRIYGDLEAVEE